MAREDLGEAIAKVLVNEKEHLNKTYNFVSEPLSMQDAAEILSEISGKEVKYNNVDPTTFPDTLRKLQVPEKYVYTRVGFMSDIQNGFLDIKDDTLEKILGRKPTPAKDVLKKELKL